MLLEFVVLSMEERLVELGLGTGEGLVEVRVGLGSVGGVVEVRVDLVID